MAEATLRALDELVPRLFAQIAKGARLFYAMDLHVDPALLTPTFFSALAARLVRASPVFHMKRREGYRVADVQRARPGDLNCYDIVVHLALV